MIFRILLKQVFHSTGGVCRDVRGIVVDVGVSNTRVASCCLRLKLLVFKANIDNSIVRNDLPWGMPSVR